eukprot:36965_1
MPGYNRNRRNKNHRKKKKKNQHKKRNKVKKSQQKNPKQVKQQKRLPVSEKKISIKKPKQNNWLPSARQYVILDFDSVVQQEKDIILSLIDHDFPAKIKLVIFDYVKPPIQHLNATFEYKHKGTGFIVYKGRHRYQGSTLYTIQKCDDCGLFFNQQIKLYIYKDRTIRDWFFYPMYQCSVCRKNLCSDCDGSSIHYLKINYCADDRCKVKGPLGTVLGSNTKDFCRYSKDCGDEVWCIKHQTCGKCGSPQTECQIPCHRSNPGHPIDCGADFCSKTFKRCPYEGHKRLQRQWEMS